MTFSNYKLDGFYDELFEREGTPRPAARILFEQLKTLPIEDLRQRQQATDAILMDAGVTFNVYSSGEGTERVWPLDLVPRVIDAEEWKQVETGLKQRVYALNLFIDDLYHDKKIIKDGVVPEDVIRTSKCYLPQLEGLDPPRGVWCHITGSDLIRDSSGRVYVLEDNMRCPSGVSYVLENRAVMKRTFPGVFESSHVLPVDDYPSRLLETLQHLGPDPFTRPMVVLLTPGIYNSAYFEHSFLARQMGIELVQGGDLVVVDGFVKMRTTHGLQRVDVIYRRIDDDFLDPLAFRPDSMLGVPGLYDVYRAGRVALANAPGTGIADDKVVYAYVPEIIKYYLNEDPVLPNVETFLCWQPEARQHVLANLERMVVKSANESGGYGMLIGPAATAEERADFAEKIKENPRNFIAQPTLALSRVPVIDGDKFEGRHVDLRPFVLYGEDIYVQPGGLTRVAMRKGSLVVNSSQGGGSKDTWVISTNEHASGDHSVAAWPKLTEFDSLRMRGQHA
jgi:uncharacterized circularly permuted ATP-grasp superfamily protein